MSAKSLPHVSFLIPVYNAEKHIGRCLKSIFSQSYRKDRMEVLIIDGGSTDKTLEIAKDFPVKVIQNKSRDAESGKSLGIVNSTGEVLAIVDADNELVSTEWLAKMVQPLLDEPRVFGVESIWTLREKDPAINRYCTHLQMPDPVAKRLASWPKTMKRKGFCVCAVDPGDYVSIGANGFLWKKSVVLEVGNYKPKYEELNFASDVVDHGFRIYAKVPEAGTYHHHVSSIQGFIRKRLKIGRKFLRRVANKQNTWIHKIGKKRFLRAFLFCASVLGPTIEAVKSYKETKDIAWFLHPFISFLTIEIYIVLLITHPVETFWY